MIPHTLLLSWRNIIKDHLTAEWKSVMGVSPKKCIVCVYLSSMLTLMDSPYWNLHKTKGQRSEYSLVWFLLNTVEAFQHDGDLQKEGVGTGGRWQTADLCDMLILGPRRFLNQQQLPPPWQQSTSKRRLITDTLMTTWQCGSWGSCAIMKRRAKEAEHLHWCSCPPHVSRDLYF